MKAIIVDDEPYSVQTIETLLKNYTPRVEVLGVAFSVKEALPLIKSNLSNLDILFLEIQMPREDGFELLKQLGDINFKIVFTTAYDNYAIKAIKFAAFDYLLKPISYVDLEACLDKLNMERKPSTTQQILNEYLESILKPNASSKFFKLAIPTIHELIFVDLCDVNYIESENSYSYIYLGNGKKITSSKSIGYYEELLPEDNFCRIHNSYLINLQKVTRFIRGKTGKVEIANTTHLDVSLRRKDQLLKKLGSQ